MLTSSKWIPVWIIGNSAVAITPWVTTYKTAKLYIWWTWNVTVTTADWETGVDFVWVPAGTVLPVLVTAVTAATATSLVLIS